MISVLKTKDDYCYAYCEWRLLDKDGKKDGKIDYVYIRDLWIHPLHQGGWTMQKLIYLLDKDIPNTINWVYWRNWKHQRLTKTFSRWRLKNKGVKYDISI